MGSPMGSTVKSITSMFHIPAMRYLHRMPACGVDVKNRSLRNFQMFNMKTHIVSELCPNVFVSRQMKELKYLAIALKKGFTKKGDMYVCKGFKFDVKPTQELYDRLAAAPLDMTNHVAAVENMLYNLEMCAHDTKASKLPMLAVREVVCKYCKGVRWINCGTHWTCTKCASTRTMVHQGPAYREMADRPDMNGCGEQKNPLLSETWHSRSFPQGPESKELKSLQNSSAKIAADSVDTAVIEARTVMEDTCAKLLIGEKVAKKALVLFCRIRNREDKLRNLNAIYAACLFSALEEPAPQFVHKRKSTYNLVPDRKRLKRIDLKKPALPTTRKKYSLPSWHPHYN